MKCKGSTPELPYSELCGADEGISQHSLDAWPLHPGGGTGAQPGRAPPPPPSPVSPGIPPSSLACTPLRSQGSFFPSQIKAGTDF